MLNLSDINVKRQLMTHIGALQGLHEVTIKERRRTRSLNQNAYYWSAYVQPFTAWMRAEWGDPTITTEQAHIELKKAVLGVETRVKEATGETLELVPTTHDKDTLEFSVYLDKAAEFLANTAGIVVLPAEMFYER